MNLWQAWHVTKWIEESGASAEQRNVVHDSEWGTVDIEPAQEELRQIQTIMEDRSTLPHEMPFPPRTSLKVGPDLGTMWEYDAATGACLVKVKGYEKPVPMDIHEALTFNSLYATN